MTMSTGGIETLQNETKFEWAWQHPEQSTRLQHLAQPRRVARKEKELPYRLRILSEMLRAGPWCRLPLTIRWLHDEYFQPFPAEMAPPSHMIIKHGPVKSKNFSKKAKKTEGLTQRPKQLCSLCYKTIYSENSKLRCVNSRCCLNFHINCLAKYFVADGEYVPIDGKCPKCSKKMLWGELIMNMRCGEYGSTNDSNDISDDSDDVELSQETNCDVMIASSDDDLR